MFSRPLLNLPFKSLSADVVLFFVVAKMSQRLASSLRADYLSCSICLEVFTQPRALPCQHSFCRKCLVNHVGNTRVSRGGVIEVACPLCRNATVVRAGPEFDPREWVNSLPVDTLIESLLATVNQHSSPDRPASRLPRLCEIHGGKSKEAFCFTHAQLVCWECAAREHRACEVDSADKARYMLVPQIDSIKEEIAKQLAKARELSRNDHTFTESKTKTLRDIHNMEKRLDKMYLSAKSQILHLRADVEECTSRHLDERKHFYDVVMCLLEQNYILESLMDEHDTGFILGTIENMRDVVFHATHDINALENGPVNSHAMRYVVDPQTDAFLDDYSSVGHIDSTVPGHGDVMADGETPRDAPSSISHILNRPAAPESTGNAATNATVGNAANKQSTDNAATKVPETKVKGPARGPNRPSVTATTPKTRPPPKKPVTAPAKAPVTNPPKAPPANTSGRVPVDRKTAAKNLNFV